MQETMLKISDFISTENIFLGVSLEDKDAVLRFIADKSRENGLVNDADLLFDGLLRREESMSTGVGKGMAFPHTTTPERNGAAVLILCLEPPVHFDAIDNEPVDIVFAILIPESNQTQHLQILARISRLCQKNEFRQSLRSSKDPGKLKNEITRFEAQITEYLYKSDT